MSIARLIVLASAVCGISASSAQAQSQKGLTATSSTVMPVAMVHDTYSLWTGGALLVVEDRHSAGPIVNVIDKSGDVVLRFTLAIPGLSLGLIYDYCMARGSDGSIVVAGSAAAPTDSHWTPFLAIVGPDGANKAVVRLSPFRPEAATIAADGTIWVAGAVPAPARGEKADTDQYLIRRYSPQGELLSSFVKWSDVTTKDRGFPPTHRSQLMASKDRIGWFSPTVHSYVEFWPDGKIMTHIKSWPSLGEHPFDSPVLCDDGSVFAAETIHGSETSPAKYGIFTLNRDTGTWDFAPRKQFTHLLGCDGTSVPGFSGTFANITWFEAASPQNDSAQGAAQR